MAERGRSGNYHEPPTTIKPVPGVDLSKQPWHDFYTGTKESLIAAGLASDGMFPGDPGRAISSMSYRPFGVEQPEGGWYSEPGFMKIERRISGVFIIALAVPREEQQRRHAAYDAARQRQDDDLERMRRFGDDFEAYYLSLSAEQQEKVRESIRWIERSKKSGSLPSCAPTSAAPRRPCGSALRLAWSASRRPARAAVASPDGAPRARARRQVGVLAREAGHHARRAVAAIGIRRSGHRLQQGALIMAVTAGYIAAAAGAAGVVQSADASRKAGHQAEDLRRNAESERKQAETLAAQRAAAQTQMARRALRSNSLFTGARDAGAGAGRTTLGV